MFVNDTLFTYFIIVLVLYLLSIDSEKCYTNTVKKCSSKKGIMPSFVSPMEKPKVTFSHFQYFVLIIQVIQINCIGDEHHSLPQHYLKQEFRTLCERILLRCLEQSTSTCKLQLIATSSCFYSSHSEKCRQSIIRRKTFGQDEGKGLHQ